MWWAFANFIVQLVHPGLILRVYAKYTYMYVKMTRINMKLANAHYVYFGLLRMQKMDVTVLERCLGRVH